VTLLGHIRPRDTFHCVEYQILLQRLRLAVGLTGVVIDWIQLFLANRTQQTTYNGHLSQTQPMVCGILLGSILGPLLYVLYMAELACVIASHGLKIHKFADETLVYVSSMVYDAAATVDRFAAGLVDFAACMV
jgi:ribonucleases P/MRP protein subunit RPP40